jgi:alkyl sulfatase BDS1-like metallo-beta-lactamase superfamily hydrolase
MRLCALMALAALAVLLAPGSSSAHDHHGHFDPKGKPPSATTVEKIKALRGELPFEDTRDFEESRRGLIATPDYRQIMSEDGKTVVWNIGDYDWLLEEGQDFDSIHPSLQRQAILNMNYGLYEIVPDAIYQVRGFDLANISFVKGETGWIILDPLTAKETAAAALKLVNDTLGARPVVAVIYSHSHVDHFGGVRGVVDEADVKDGKVQIIAPVGFLEHAVSENVYAGNAMNRRAFFQYGFLLPRHPMGHVDQAIGKATAAGTTGLIAPTRLIKDNFETLTVDGVEMVFQNTPGTEAPAEMNTYFPQWKAFWAAENITGTIHNIYTLRGALVRDPLLWSRGVNAALYKFGQEAEVMFAAHSWPRWGNDRIQEVMRTQRDTYANLNNGVLHLANQGVTINQIHNVYEVPKILQNQWAARSYHGSVEHNSRAVINRYLGYWDGNPATLDPLSPQDSAPLYVEMMGGAAPILKKGQELYDAGEYRQAQEILNKLVYAQPDNQEAKDLLADVFEQIGYQKESTSVRNSFLGGAFELRHGLPQGATPHTSSPDVIRAMDTLMWLDYLGIRLDSDKAGDAHFVVNLITPDNGETFVVELSNGTLTAIEGFTDVNPDLTVTINRRDLDEVMMGKAQLEDTAKLEGEAAIIGKLRAMLTDFELGFEILPGTVAPKASAAPSGTLKADPIADTSGG